MLVILISLSKTLLYKLLTNFSRYSIWLDSKLRLQLDPLLILEYFLWRKDYEYAISNHYDRHCVWEEVNQNKRLNKYNHTIIDQQFEFYQADGLTRFNASDPEKLLPSSNDFSPDYHGLNVVFSITILYTILFTYFILFFICRRTRRIFHHPGTYTYVKFVLLSMVQWGWPVYSSWSAKFCIYVPEVEKDESWKTFSS